MPDYDAKPWGGETASEHNAEAESEATTEGRH
jgi:hypothetical protein